MDIQATAHKRKGRRGRDWPGVPIHLGTIVMNDVVDQSSNASGARRAAAIPTPLRAVNRTLTTSVANLRWATRPVRGQKSLDGRPVMAPSLSPEIATATRPGDLSRTSACIPVH